MDSPEGTRELWRALHKREASHLWGVGVVRLQGALEEAGASRGPGRRQGGITWTGLWAPV